ncbi:MAG: hypothetical protein INR69_05845 [Mucilaginibacter polytrichastri]|nr:hypothetical protein [Mucilaginibacter polytrichastri]
MCEAVIISRKGETVISRCLHCQMLFLWQKNLMINFTYAEFLSFTRLITHYHFDDHAFRFADDQERVFVQSPNSDIGFTFTQYEWNLLKEALHETTLMLEVYQIVQ